MSESQGIIFETIVIVLKFGKLFQSKNVDILKNQWMETH
jgi:hypothetical protein